MSICEQLHIQIIAEGIETLDEYLCLEAMGLYLMQGYLFARPLFESCASEGSIKWPRLAAGAVGAASGDALEYDPFAGVDITRS